MGRSVSSGDGIADPDLILTLKHVEDLIVPVMDMQGKANVKLANGPKPTPYLQGIACGRLVREPRHEASERQHARHLGAVRSQQRAAPGAKPCDQGNHRW